LWNNENKQCFVFLFFVAVCSDNCNDDINTDIVQVQCSEQTEKKKRKKKALFYILSQVKSESWKNFSSQVKSGSWKILSKSSQVKSGSWKIFPSQVKSSQQVWLDLTWLGLETWLAHLCHKSITSNKRCSMKIEKNPIYYFYWF
jgi:hypothetical protein